MLGQRALADRVQVELRMMRFRSCTVATENLTRTNPARVRTGGGTSGAGELEMM